MPYVTQIPGGRPSSLTARAGPNQPLQKLVGDIRAIIEAARGRMAQAVNAGLVMLYWNIGQRIRQDILKSRRAEYGQKIVRSLSARLVGEYGSGFDRSMLFRAVRFNEVYPDRQIVATVWRLSILTPENPGLCWKLGDAGLLRTPQGSPR